jgi:hypothetical protein
MSPSVRLARILMKRKWKLACEARGVLGLMLEAAGSGLLLRRHARGLQKIASTLGLASH